MRINVRVAVILFPNPDSVLGQGFREFPVVWRIDTLNRSFSAASSTIQFLGRLPQAQVCTAPLALKMYVITDHGPLTHLPRPCVAVSVAIDERLDPARRLQQ